MRIKVKELLLASSLAVCLLAAPATEAGIFGGCVDDVTAGIKPNQVPNNCTANDVTFNAVGLGTQTNGCVTPGDLVEIFLGGTVRNTTAQTRYDVGLYIATDGDPNGDGALSGSCYREIFSPLGAVTPKTCPPLDLDGGSGPYLNVDGDSCGDLFNQSAVGCDQNSDGFWDDSFIVFQDALTLSCTDDNNNGFVDIPTCATWGNQSTEVGSQGGPTGFCDSEAEVIPGTKAKCRCEELDSTIPVPNLSLTCGCAPATIGRGGPNGDPVSTTCTVTYLNSVTCTPSLSTPERFRCGTGSFLRFETSYDDTKGSVSAVMADHTGSATDNGSGLITWIPRNQNVNFSQGVIGPNNQTETMSFVYTAAPDIENGTVTVTTNTYWSNTSPTDPAAVLQSTLTCSFDITTTPVSLAWARARRAGDRLRLQWTTATEAGNTGFNVDVRRDGQWQRVNAEPVASKVVSSTSPVSYELWVDAADADAFRIEDVDLHGRATLHGPFAVGAEHGDRPRPEAVDWGAVHSASAQAADERRGPVARVTAAARGGNGAAAPQPVQLLVSESGLQRVTSDDLLAAGLDMTGVRDRDLALFDSSGAPVPVRVENLGNGHKFSSGAFLEFHGETPDSLYTATNVYTLRVERNGAVDVAEDATPAPAGAVSPDWYAESRRTEHDRAYSVNAPGPDPWVDRLMLAFASPRSFSVDLEVDELYAAAGAAGELSVELWGVTDWESLAPDHHVRLLVNGTLVADESWDGAVRRDVSAPLPAGLLHEGVNELTVELPADTGAASDVLVLESWTLGWPRRPLARDGALDLTAAGAAITVGGLPDPDVRVYRLDAAGPVLLSGATVAADGADWAVTFPGGAAPATYRVTSSTALGTPQARSARPADEVRAELLAGEARWLAIAHPDFVAGTAPLAARRAADGWSTDVVSVEDVYTAYSGGMVDAEALRAYVADAVATRGTEAVLLVGGDTYDYFDHLGLGSVSFVPSLYAATSDLVHHAPADPLVGDLDGDGVPEVAVGRLPVRTAQELAVLVGKIADYEGKSYDRTVVSATDRFDAANGISFALAGDSFLNGLQQAGPPWSSERVSLDNLPVGTARARLTAAIDSGVALTSYVGHSGPTVWSFSGLFRSSDAAALDNPGRPTVVVQWGCWNTYHVHPAFNTLGHRLLLSGDRGAAAVLGAATLVQHNTAELLAERLAPLLATPGVSLGEAMTRAKAELVTTGGRTPQQLRDVLIGWTLLGDPAMTVEP